MRRYSSGGPEVDESVPHVKECDNKMTRVAWAYGTRKVKEMRDQVEKENGNMHANACIDHQ